MKTLYITDLDGTFLDNSGRVSEKSKEIINRLSDDGLLFSVATARSVLSAAPLLDGIKITAPIVAMSGVVIFDTQTKRTVKYFPIENEAFYAVIKIFEKYNKAPFSFFFNEKEEYQIVFTELKLDVHKAYYESRSKMGGTNIHRVERYEIPDDYKPLFISICDKYEDLTRIKSEIDKIPSLSYSFYKDTYTEYWFLEVFDRHVSKANGLLFVKEYIKADKTVAFGDNLNDLSLFIAADTRCAVNNSVDELKEKADILIDSNEVDGVAKYIENDFTK